MEQSTSTTTVKIGLFTAISLVIANQIGTGVFTSLGFQVATIPSVFPLLMLWVVGGIIALCGALSYGELGAALPRSGGEYHLLTTIYHPILGYLSGWVSAILGFAAPTALAAIALSKYTQAVFPEVPGDHLAALVVVIISMIHIQSLRWGSLFQDVFTIIKVLLILFFIAAVFWVDQPQSIRVLPQWQDMQLVTSSNFAVALIYVSYAYTGWNAAIYIVDEIKSPLKNLPKALFIGTLTVLILYVLLNFVFLYTVPMSDLSGVVEIAFPSAVVIFGISGGKIMALIIAILLISTVSAMVFVGPRITMVMGQDLPALRFFAYKNRNNIPTYAIVIQAVVTLAFIYTSSFEQVLIYASFMLVLFTTLTVMGVFVLRITRPNLPRPYKTWGYPFTPALYLALSSWTLVYVFIDKPKESLIGIAIGLSGLVVYFFNWYLHKRKTKAS